MKVVSHLNRNSVLTLLGNKGGKVMGLLMATSDKSRFHN